MDNINTLSYEERYLLGYMQGFRIGEITALRKILINCLNIKAKEQGIVPEKRLVQKINRETDTEFLRHIVYELYSNKLSVKELEMYYDMYFLVLDEEKKEKKLWRNYENYTA